MLNKSTTAALAAMSRLAEVWDGGETTLTAAQLAETRNLPKAFVAKLLTVLSAANLTKGYPGRVGGYALARAPETITLQQIAECFERKADPDLCPFGPGHCGHGPKCPIHDDMMGLQEDVQRFLSSTTLAVFAPHPGKRGRR